MKTKYNKTVVAYDINGVNGCYVSTGNKTVMVERINLFDGEINTILVNGVESSYDAEIFVINMFCGYFKPQKAYYVKS